MLGSKPDHSIVLKIIADDSSHAAGGQGIGAGQKIGIAATRVCLLEVAHRQFGDSDDLISLFRWQFGGEFFVGAPNHVEVDMGDRAEAAALKQYIFFVEEF